MITNKLHINMFKSCFIDFKSEKNSALPNEECCTGILNVIKDNIPDDLHKSLYHTLFESHLTYGITV